MTTKEPNVTKKDLVHEVADELQIADVTSVGAIIQHFLDKIRKNLSENKRMEFRNFGVFEVKARRAKKGRNIKKKIQVDIPASLVVKFSPGKELCDAMDQLKLKRPELLTED